MANRGRGRGKVLNTVMSSQKPSKAGQSSGKQGTAKIPKDIEGLGTYFFSLNESNFKQYGSVFAEMAIGYSSTKEKLEEAVDLVYDTTVSDRDSANLGAMISEAIINYEAMGTSTSPSITVDFRKCLLAHFQIDFQQKDVLRGQSVEAWLGVFAFLCHIYKRIQINAQPIAVIGRAILSSAENTLQNVDVVDDEIDCICTHLKLCGNLLESNHPQPFESIFTNLRRLIIKRQTSCMVRCVVLELIELRYMSWSDPKKVLDKFYVDALADAVAEDELGNTN